MGYRWLSWTTPNQITALRILLVPVLMALLYYDHPWGNTVAMLVFIFAGFTDYVDGNLARFRNEVTNLGRLLDPIADKMLVTASLVMLVESGHAGAVATILVLMREFAVSALRQVAALDGVALASVPGAKWKTTLQMLATGILIMSVNPLGVPLELVGRITLWAATIITVWTGIGYFRSYFQAHSLKSIKA